MRAFMCSYNQERVRVCDFISPQAQVTQRSERHFQMIFSLIRNTHRARVA